MSICAHPNLEVINVIWGQVRKEFEQEDLDGDELNGWIYRVNSVYKIGCGLFVSKFATSLSAKNKGKSV